jgi:hypothetical protein
LRCLFLHRRRRRCRAWRCRPQLINKIHQKNLPTETA